MNTIVILLRDRKFSPHGYARKNESYRLLVVVSSSSFVGKWGKLGEQKTTWKSWKRDQSRKHDSAQRGKGATAKTPMRRDASAAQAPRGGNLRENACAGVCSAAVPPKPLIQEVSEYKAIHPVVSGTRMQMKVGGIPQQTAIAIHMNCSVGNSKSIKIRHHRNGKRVPTRNRFCWSPTWRPCDPGDEELRCVGVGW
jgi:hypothetical protein